MSNRLIHEQSPYLLQHAHNPVDWHPWGQTAFDRARAEHKPIFLSVGYSTCHWCHVMERESFENEDIARVLNEHFVSIKVDREERPDIDHVYMTFVQATTGGGGWPMSVFLTPDLAPFFGGTYFPPEPRYGSPGFVQVLLGIAREWRDDPLGVTSSAGRVIQALRSIQGGTPRRVGDDVLQACYRHFASSYDKVYGGFEGAPKFPRPAVFDFLFRYGVRTGTSQALSMSVDTLKKMALGGIHDHVGGGFHRYSVDAAWHVPHFEKMLYDQAQLVIAYAEAWQNTADPDLRDTMDDILTYVLRDLRAPEGGFYSAEDADSPIPEKPDEKGEGAFYLWTDDQVRSLLPDPDASLFIRYYDVRSGGNVEYDPHDEFAGKSILHVTGPQDDTDQRLAGARQRLLEVRSQRPRPHLDDKILTSWNGMMIAALARAAEVSPDHGYLEAATSAAQFIWDRLRQPANGELWRRYRGGATGIDGQLDDYAHAIRGYLNLYEACLEPIWIDRAVELQEKQDQLFWDADDGAYFDTNGRDPSVLLRTRSDYDGAEPSANSVSALNLLRLALLTDRAAWTERAEQVLQALGGRTPAAIPSLLVAADWLLSAPVHVVIAGTPGAPDTETLLRSVRTRFVPHRVISLVDGGPRQAHLARWLPYLEAVRPVDGKATAYLCDTRGCRQPMTEPSQLAAALTP